MKKTSLRVSMSLLSAALTIAFRLLRDTPQNTLSNVAAASVLLTHTTEGEQNMPPQNTSLWYMDYFELQTFVKQESRERLFLNFLYLPKDKILQMELSCHQSPPQEFHQLGTIDSSPKRRREVVTTPRHTWSQTLIPSIYFWNGPFILPTSLLHFLYGDGSED